MKGSLRFVSCWLIACLFILFGLVRRAKAKAFKGEYILSIYFHKPSSNEFENCIKWLKSKGFQFLSTNEVHAIMERQLPFPKGAVVLTVDDGWYSNKRNIAEVSEKYQVPVTIFVSTDPVEQGAYWWSYVEEAQRRKLCNTSVEQLKLVPNEKRLVLVNELQQKLHLPREAMTMRQIQQIAASKWVTIGGHTLSHPILNNCTTEQVYQELNQSKKKLQSWTGQPIDYFAYPNGDYSKREIQLLSDFGYKLAFTVRPDYLYEHKLRDRYELPRFEVIENASFAETICRLMGVWEPIMLRLRKLLTIQRKTSSQIGTPYAGREEDAPVLNF